MKKLIKICLVLTGLLLLVVVFLPVSRERLDNSKWQSLRIYDCNGELLRELLSDEQGRGVWISIDNISPYLIATTIAVEDKRYYHHFGIDPMAMARAAWSNLRAGRVVSGGSTITQQLARHMYRLPHTWPAKILQALLAVRLEIYLSKRQILEQYLNRIPYGNQLFGIEAASRTYLDKPAGDLSWSEAAFLAGLPKSPTRYNPYLYPNRVHRRQQQILKILRQRGHLDEDQYRMAVAMPLRIIPAERKFKAPHFCQMVASKLREMSIPEDRRIMSTLNGSLQSTIEKLTASHIKTLNRHHVTNAAVIVLENATNRVKAWVGSADFFDVHHQGQVDGVLALRQPGSAIKPFIYGLALENGFTAADILPDIETHAATEGGDFRVHNYDEKYHGPVRLRTALACSYNVASVRLLQRLGPDLLLSKLRLAGLTSLDQAASYYGLGLTLGNGEVRLRDLTNAYAALARQGEFLPINFFQQLSSDRRKEQPPSYFIFPPTVAFLLTDILSDPVARAPAFGLGSPLRLPFACAAKTGTTKDFRDNWTIGFTRDYTVGVWVGNFDGQPMQKISGITGAAPLFRDVMMTLHQKEYPPNFLPPKGVERTTICAASGAKPTPQCPGVLQEWFLQGTVPRETCSVHKRIAIDRRSGSMADSKTPQRFIKEVVFEVWPPEYHGWMQSVGLLQAPPLIAAATDEKTTLAIIFPDDGDMFKIDPILRRDYQTITCEALVPPGISEIEWVIDDVTIAKKKSPFKLQWKLQLGEHTLQIIARRNDQLIKSNKVRINVY